MKRIFCFIIGLFCFTSIVYARVVKVYYFKDGADTSSSNVDISKDLIALNNGDYYSTYSSNGIITKLNSINGQVFTIGKTNDYLVPEMEWMASTPKGKIYYYSQSESYSIDDILETLGLSEADEPEIDFHANWKSEYDKRTVVRKISFDESSVDVHVGASKKVKAYISPDTVTEAKLSWSSSNTKIATVNNKGYVDGKKKGTATITVTSDNGKKASFTVKVGEVAKNTHYVHVRYSTGGGRLNSVHGNSISVKSEKIYCGDSLDCTAIPYGDKMIKTGLRNVNHPNNINLLKDGYYLDKTEAWKDNNGKIYSQSKVYKASDFCNASKKDCTVTLTPNWKKDDSVYKIALIGNSKTYYGVREHPSSRVAEIFRALSTFNGKSAKVEVIAKGGTTLLFKANNEPYKNDIAKEKYKYVVLQEQTTTARQKDTTEYREGVNAVLSLLKNKNAKIYLRTSWPMYKIEEKGKEEADRIYSNQLDKMNEHTDYIANIVGAKPIHDGNAFKEAMNNGMDMYIEDYNHPTVEGAYLAAACIYKNIYNEKATRINYYFGIDSDIAEKLLEIANNNC